MMKTVMAGLDRLMHLDEVFGSLALFALFLIALANALMRYFLNAPLAWAEEVLQLLLVWATFLGASALVRRNEHVLIDLFGERLPKPLERWRERIFNVVMIMIAAGVMLYWGLELLPFAAFRSTPMLQIPYFWVYLVIPLSAVMMLYHGARRLFSR
ncbi:TRAP transporter small permease [Kushneria sp. TE3]|uniref:TRAP transporter small permease n=1 Tax=Kushneria sp. TE3 TaxID=3449832 RepID=UPI003F68369C